MHSAASVASLPRRDRLLIASSILLVTALAWAYLLHLDGQMSSSMEEMTMMAKMGMVMDTHWGVRDVLLTFLMWFVMMVGMMSAAATPVLLLFAGMQARRAERGRLPLPVLLFGLGYLTVWLGFSGAAALAQWALHETAMLSATMAVSSPGFAGAILIAAGGYQLSSIKGACLTQCQSPIGFLMANWRDGPGGALQMGLRHGIYCLGCCWALMCVLFAVGVMNLVWVAVLTLFILIEKLGGSGGRLTQVGGVLMVAFGIFVIAG